MNSTTGTADRNLLSGYIVIFIGEAYFFWPLRKRALRDLMKSWKMGKVEVMAEDFGKLQCTGRQ